MYCDEGYGTHRYNVLHSVNKWVDERKGGLLPVADPSRQKLLARPSPILACAKNSPDLYKELADSSGQAISTIAPQPRNFYLLQNEARDRELQKEILSTLQDVNLVKRPNMSSKSLISQARSTGRQSILPLQSKQPLVITSSSVSQDMHKILENRKETYVEHVSSCSDSEQGALERLLKKPLTLADHKRRQLSKQATQMDNQDLEHESIFQGIRSPDYHELSASTTENSWTDASQQNLLNECEYSLHTQVKSPDDVHSQSNPTQSETIYGNILSFERRLLPESGNDSFAIHPLQYYTSGDMTLQSCENSESTRLSAISIPLLSTDTPTEQSSDVSTHCISQHIGTRLSCDAPISPMASRVPTATPPPTHAEHGSRRIPHICISPPLSIQPSVPPSKLLSSQYDPSSPAKEEAKPRLRHLLRYAIDSNSSSVQHNTKIWGRFPKRSTSRSFSAPRTQSQTQSQTTHVASRLQERGAQNFYRKPDPTKLAGLIVHSLVAIEPISFQNTAHMMPTDSMILPAPLAPISSKVNHAGSLTDVHGVSVPQKYTPPINVGMSRYPPQLRAFIKASTSSTKSVMQRLRTKIAPSASSRLTTTLPKLRCYKLRSVSARTPITHVEPLRSDPLSFRPRTAPALSPLSPHSPADIRLLYNTPMTIGKENIIRSVKDVSSPYSMHDVRIFPEDLSNSQPVNPLVEYQTPHAPPRSIRSVYAPMKIPSNEEQISTMCDIVSARTNALTEEDIEEIKQIFYNTSHDSASSLYAQQLAAPGQRNYVTRLFNDIRKDADIRRVYGIDKVKRGLNMELYKRIKHSNGDSVIHKVRGVQPDTDSSSPDGFEPPDFRELISETNSPENAAAADRNLKTIKAFIYTPSSSHLEESPPTDCSKDEQYEAHGTLLDRQNYIRATVKTPMHNPVISILKRFLVTAPNRLATAPSHNLRRDMAETSFLSKSGMMMDYIAYLHTYTPKLRAPPSHYRIAKSAPLNAAPRDSKLTKLLKEELNKQQHTSIGISRSVSCALSRNLSSRPATCSVLVKTLSTIDDAGSQVILDDQEDLTDINAAAIGDCSVEPIAVLQETRRCVEEARGGEIVSEVLANRNDECRDIQDEDQCAHQNSDSLSSDSTPMVVFAEDEPDIDEATTKSVIHVPGGCANDSLEEPPPNPPLDKHDKYPRRKAIPGDKTVSNRKACRRFYKEAIIDRDVSRIYRTYTQRPTPQSRPCTAAQLNYEKLLSRPLTVSKEKIAERVGLHQTDAKRINLVTPSFGMQANYLH